MALDLIMMLGCFHNINTVQSPLGLGGLDLRSPQLRGSCSGITAVPHLQPKLGVHTPTLVVIGVVRGKAPNNIGMIPHFMRVTQCSEGPVGPERHLA